MVGALSNNRGATRRRSGGPRDLADRCRLAYDAHMNFAHAICLAWLFAAGVALGQAPAAASADTGFDCWIGADGPPDYTHYIRCVSDRDIAPKVSADRRHEDVMQQLRREVRDGSSATAERAFQANFKLIHEAAGVWNIRIHSYPSDWSWREGMPERLVRAVLCPPEGPCSVLIRK
jgi:hypothetical protein